ncbi:MAG: phosphoribosyltransferase family protein [Chitinophagaceae bacterium]
MQLVKNIANDFSHLFFPHVCAGCGNDAIGEDSLLCVQCIDQLPLTNFHFHANNPVEKHFWGRLPLVAATSLCHFTTGSLVQHLLHQLKYKGNQEIGYFVGRIMGNAFTQSERFRHIDVLVPLPLFAARQKKRGYNQATVLCNGIAEVMHVPVANDAIKRLSATETQTRKSRIERWKNMEGKFELNDISSIENKHVLLLDDVVTTGATLEACGHELLKASGVKLSIATLAYTV